ncbi:hypothetical protein COOONC_23946, partial [Cooperia oncophora]
LKNTSISFQRSTTAVPDALSPPGSLTWINGDATTAQNEFEDDYEILGMTRPAARAAQPPPPPPQQFIPVGRSPQRPINPLYHNPNARTFVNHQRTVPPPIR